MRYNKREPVESPVSKRITHLKILEQVTHSFENLIVTLDPFSFYKSIPEIILTIMVSSSWTLATSAQEFVKHLIVAEISSQYPLCVLTLYSLA